MVLEETQTGSFRNVLYKFDVFSLICDLFERRSVDEASKRNEFVKHTRSARVPHTELTKGNKENAGCLFSILRNKIKLVDQNYHNQEPKSYGPKRTLPRMQPTQSIRLYTGKFRNFFPEKIPL